MHTLSSVIDILFFHMELVGCIAFALSGVLTAIEKNLDLLGVLVLGSVTAVGGGVIRDLLLGITPPFMFRTPVYFYVAVCTSLLAFFIALLFRDTFFQETNRLSPIINIMDAVGLGIFTVFGVRTSILNGYISNAFLSVFVGIITGVGGGILRDMFVGKVPMIFHKHIYALAAFAGASLYYILARLDVSELISMPVGVLCIIAIRLFATHYRWNLPHIFPKQKNSGDESPHEN